MKKLIKFPKIGQFREIVSSVNRLSNYIGDDENGLPIYEALKTKPTITFLGTVKLHGTNAGISYNRISGMWYQSRENIITIEKDNAGFAFFAEARRKVLEGLFFDIQHTANIDCYKNTITIYGEFAGGNIQKGVALNQLEKSFYVFGVKITPFNETLPAYWIPYSYVRSIENKIYNINNFKTYRIDINFNSPEISAAALSSMTIDVENECPVAKQFGFSGIGEGIVWTSEDYQYRFKVKGEKHSATKVKTLTAVDVERVNDALDFVNYAVTENRYSQAVENVFPNKEPLDIKKLGELIKWTLNDVIKEELDTISKNNLEIKDINKPLALKVKEFFLASL